MDGKYYFKKFLKITGICFLVNLLWSGILVYIGNSLDIKLAIFERDIISIAIIKYMLMSTLWFVLILSLLLSGLITLMYYAQKENKKYIKYTIITISCLVLLFLIYRFIK